MTASLVMSLAACNGNVENVSTTEATTAEVSVTEPTFETTEPISDASESTEPAATEPAAETTTEAASEAPDGTKKPETTAEVLDYFNDVINKVKPDSKKITQNFTLNTQVSDLELGKAKSLESLANSLINSNMGYIDADNMRVITSTADRNKYFPVENMTWSSKLTQSDIKSATLSEKNGIYTITIKPKDDAASAETSKGSGHVGKAMSVVDVPTILENAGGAKSIIKNVKTGHRDAKIVITVDAKTGNVTHANYYFTWDLCLTADIKIFSVDLTVSFGIEKDFDIQW